MYMYLFLSVVVRHFKLLTGVAQRRFITLQALFKITFIVLHILGQTRNVKQIGQSIGFLQG
jgi:hypothetical protein